MLHLGLGLVSLNSYEIASRCRGQKVCLCSLQARSIVMDPDSMSYETHLEPTPSVVWQCRPVSMRHPLQLHRRKGGRSKQALRGR